MSQERSDSAQEEHIVLDVEELRRAEARWRGGIRCRLVAVSVAAVVVIVVMVYFAFFTKEKAPSLVDDLRAGVLEEEDVARIHILKFDPGAGWPFEPEEYARKARVSLALAEQRELLRILRTESTDGLKHRHHPATYYYGILEIETKSGDQYFAYYHIEHFPAGYTMALNANHRNDMNPNHAKPYENGGLVRFLRKHDPWFRDASSPPSWPYRPNFPDSVP